MNSRLWYTDGENEKCEMVTRRNYLLFFIFDFDLIDCFCLFVYFKPRCID